MASLKRSFLKSASYAFSSNLTSFIISTLIVLVVPKLIGSVEYGYFQYYTLLATYAAYFHLGICNGITLKDSGKEYSQLDRPTLASQHRLLVEFALIICVLFQFVPLFVSFDGDKLYMLRLVSVIIIFVNSRVFSTTVLLASSRFKEYSRVIIIEKVLYILFLITVLALGVRDYRVLIWGDILGKVAAALLGVYYCRDIVFAKCISWKARLLELLDNFKIGVFILITNISSIMIPSIIQFFVEHQWDMETFGKVSLSFNISKMLMLVINAVSLVLLPFLKNVDQAQLAKMYNKIRQPLMTILIILLLSYYPLRLILEIWLPQYKDSIFYASLLFPMCLFESKTTMLISTYLKALRKERWLCLANIITVALGFGLAWFMAFVLKNLLLTVVLIPILFAFRSAILEYPLAGLLKISVMKEAFIEILIAAAFILVNYFFPTGIACILYCGVVVIYLATHWKSILEIVGGKKGLFRRISSK